MTEGAHDHWRPFASGGSVFTIAEGSRIGIGEQGMGDAGHEVALRPGWKEREPSDPVERLVERYLSAVDGDARHALRQAVSDGLEAAALLSRGFARWGRSDHAETR